MTTAEPVKIPRPPLSKAQRTRQAANSRRSRERRMMYPKDPTDPKGRRRITRDSPRKLFPYVENTISLRTCVEHPTKHPNRFLYLLQRTDTDVACYVWYQSNGEAWNKSLAKPYGTLYPSIYAACLATAQAGYLDASW